ncbi:predicted protein [Streptomyces viridosporus ATCC 14672]|uniref:Predicted protein n=1 Tax=Streptomyces viridosporus (strain ATCC 14672 / DSM 40746 / JCM 4963 / KCTC 9882 / NRRL B-12104 / FH 1290) TaxID=566461 RepID=D5ZS86_STRV1|nr:predicted protein [Streptomyces viridosporus ATCC 14672]
MSSHHTAPAREPTRLPSYVEYTEHEVFPHDAERAYAV